MAKVDVGNCIMIGDNYEADILGALHVGFDVIHYNYHKEEVAESIIQISNLLDLKSYL